MAIRLYNKEYRNRATKELLAILKEHPEGMRTGDLQGTSQFHGERTLSFRQIGRLLEESNDVLGYIHRQGKYHFVVWKLKEMNAASHG